MQEKNKKNTKLNIQMKKSVILSILLIFGAYSLSNAATKSKASVLKDFFVKKGANVIQNWAHPLSKYYSDKTVITIASGTVVLNLYYSRNGYYFNCKYSVVINPAGYFSSLKVTNEGYSKYPCFSTCEKVKDRQKNINIYSGDRELVKIMESFLHKTISAFLCEDYCLLGLNYYWKFNKYRANYLAQGK